MMWCMTNEPARTADIRRWHHLRRWAFPLIVAALAYQGTSSGVLHAGIIAGQTTGDANNDDYSGTFADNPNTYHINIGDDNRSIATLEVVVPVLASGGMTEYAVTIDGSYNSDVDGSIKRPYRMQLGFGTGANFVPASRVLPGLDFDLPLPSSPGLEQTITVFVITLFTLESHSADTILWQGVGEGGGYGDVGGFELFDLFKIPI